MNYYELTKKELVGFIQDRINNREIEYDCQSCIMFIDDKFVTFIDMAGYPECEPEIRYRKTDNLKKIIEYYLEVEPEPYLIISSEMKYEVEKITGKKSEAIVDLFRLNETPRKFLYPEKIYH